MWLVIPKKKGRIELVNMKAVRKIIVQEEDNKTKIVLVDDRPIGKIFVEKGVELEALRNLTTLANMESGGGVMGVNEDGKLVLLRDIVKEYMEVEQ